MELHETGAAKVAEKFNEILHPTEQIEDCLYLAHWGMWIRMQMMNCQENDGSIAVHYRATTYLDRLTQPVVDMAIGWGETLDDANELAAETYMSTVFPVVHSICCDQQCEYGVECTTQYSKDDHAGVVRDWRVIVGPAVKINANEEIADDAMSSILEQRITELIRSPGTYWFKCFISNFDGGADADCFLNNVEQSELKQRFIDYASTMPANSTCKHHVLAYPDDPQVASSFRQSRREEMEHALTEVSKVVSPEDLDKVLSGIELFGDFQNMDENFLCRVLSENGLSATEARKVVSFLPTACTLCQWEPKGTKFGSTYHLLDYDTRKSLEFALDDDSLYRTTKSVVSALRAQRKVPELLDNILEFSAENNCLCDAVDNDVDQADVTMSYLIVPSDEPVDGDFNDELLDVLGLKKKAWWQFWKR